jgi:2-methylisocitrate lyase-like PEP mutase family enzyme
VEGFSEAIDRAGAYKDAGADVLFVEAPQSLAEMRKICAEFSDQIPLLANMVEGGKTPILCANDLAVLGYKIAIFPGGAVRAISHHMEAYYINLLANGSNDSFSSKMHNFDDLNDLIGTKELIEHGAKYENKGND